MAKAKRWKISIGRVKRLGGVLSYAQFHCHPDPLEPEVDYRRKFDAVQALWKAKQARGDQFWHESEIQEMAEQGLIYRAPRYMKKKEAIELILKDQKEPLKETELSPLCDENGDVKVENAVPLVDLIARNIVTRKDYRISLFKQLWEDSLKDPKGLFEWCARNLNWNGKQVSTFLNLNLSNNGGNVGHIAFDASEETPDPDTTVIDSGEVE